MLPPTQIGEHFWVLETDRFGINKSPEGYPGGNRA